MKYRISGEGLLLGGEIIEGDKFEVNEMSNALFLIMGDRVAACFPAGSWTSIREDDADPDKFADATKQAAT